MNKLREVVNQSRASIEKKDLEILLRILEPEKPLRILEIGMHQGYSMEFWRKAFKPLVLNGIEINKPTPESYIGEIGMLWQTDSHNSETLSKVRREYDFLFIDGDHSYEGVKRDWEMYEPLVRKCGVIAFHDCCYHADGTEEVDIFWNELKKDRVLPYIEIQASDNSTGLGVMFKCKEIKS